MSRRAVSAVVVVVAVVALVACGSDPAPKPVVARPDVAGWKTWVLPSADAVAVAPPSSGSEPVS
ncbi:MAG: hypothetical protein QOD63_2344, partial [Actinomycetota bacterium]|nr:hypothetical protein [Actinomycetota bacterium]